MKFKVLLLLALVPSASVSNSKVSNNVDLHDNICHENPVLVAETIYKDYQITISSAGDRMCESFDIVKSGRILYHDEEIGAHFYFGADIGEMREPFLDLKDGGDIKFVLSKWTGGAHCCYSLRIFELGRDFKSIAHIDGGNFHPEFEDINMDGIPELNVTDDFLAYRFSSFAYSATAKVVLKYSEGTFRVASDLMRKPAPDFYALNRMIQSWRGEFNETTAGDFPPPPFIQTLTDLYFTGNQDLAQIVMDRAWPANITGKAEFAKSYETALRESGYYDEFAR